MKPTKSLNKKTSVDIWLGYFISHVICGSYTLYKVQMMKLRIVGENINCVKL